MANLNSIMRMAEQMREAQSRKKVLVPSIPPIEPRAPRVLEAEKPLETNFVATTRDKHCGEHYLTPLILRISTARIGQDKIRPNIALIGPAGSGKSSAAGTLAKHLKLERESTPFCGQSTQTNLLGYMDAHGKYQGTAFRRRYEQGGIFLADELDAANPNVCVVLNDGTSNGSMSFPDKTVIRHNDFMLVAGLNTWGQGATVEYQGRNALDAATLDRFCFILWNYDEGFEAYLAGIQGVESPSLNLEEGGIPSKEYWFSFIQRVRRAAEFLKIKMIVSPRATFTGCALLEVGIGMSHLERMLIWKGMDTITINKVKGEM